MKRRDFLSILTSTAIFSTFSSFLEKKNALADNVFLWDYWDTRRFNATVQNLLNSNSRWIKVDLYSRTVQAYSNGKIVAVQPQGRRTTYPLNFQCDIGDINNPTVTGLFDADSIYTSVQMSGQRNLGNGVYKEYNNITVNNVVFFYMGYAIHGMSPDYRVSASELSAGCIRLNLFDSSLLYSYVLNYGVNYIVVGNSSV